MNAGRLLSETGYDTEAFRAWIAPIDPYEINVWPASWLLRRFWRTGISAVTVWRYVFVDPEVMRGDRNRFARLVVHELVHVRQYVTVGFARFLIRYLREYWVGRLAGRSPRDAYVNISVEREAREVTDRIVN